MLFLHKAWHRGILIFAFIGAAMLILAWVARTDPAVSFLPRDRGADWIVFPTAVDARGHLGGGVDATFRREFVLSNRPAMARLSIRAMRRVEVKINDALVLSQPGRNWKENTSIDVSEQLHAGQTRSRRECLITAARRRSGSI